MTRTLLYGVALKKWMMKENSIVTTFLMYCGTADSSMNIKKLFLLVFCISTTISFVVNLLVATLTVEDYFSHEVGYYVGSFLASSTIGIVLTIIAITLLRKINHVQD